MLIPIDFSVNIVSTIPVVIITKGSYQLNDAGYQYHQNKERHLQLVLPNNWYDWYHYKAKKKTNFCHNAITK
jgi:hypothetical protein